MDERMAQHVIDMAPHGFNSATAREWYNATATPYLQGLLNGDERLLGKKIGVVGPGADQKITVKVPRHGVKMFRLRCYNNESKRYSIAKEEL